MCRGFVEGALLWGWKRSAETERCVGGPLGAAVSGEVLGRFDVLRARKVRPFTVMRCIIGL